MLNVFNYWFLFYSSKDFIRAWRTIVYDIKSICVTFIAYFADLPALTTSPPDQATRAPYGERKPKSSKLKSLIGVNTARVIPRGNLDLFVNKSSSLFSWAQILILDLIYQVAMTIGVLHIVNQEQRNVVAEIGEWKTTAHWVVEHAVSI